MNSGAHIAGYDFSALPGQNVNKHARSLVADGYGGRAPVIETTRILQDESSIH